MLFISSGFAYFLWFSKWLHIVEEYYFFSVEKKLENDISLRWDRIEINLLLYVSGFAYFYLNLSLFEDQPQKNLGPIFGAKN